MTSAKGLAVEKKAIPIWYSAAVILMGLAGVLLVLSNTRWGAYLSDDTYYYIYPARDLLAGKGFHPSYIFAPLFPLALAVMGLLGLDALDAARWLNALLFGVNIFLVGRLVLRMNLPAAFALLASALVLLADVVVEAHGWAMSEALAFTMMLACLDCTLSYLKSGERRWWWGAALTAALTVLTRYASIPLVAAAALTLLFFAPIKSPVKRAIEAALFGVVSLLPITAYWLRNLAVAGHPVRYENFFFEPLTRDQLIWFFYHWLSLFIPGRLLRGREILAGAAAGLALAALAGLLYWAIRSRRLQAESAFQTAPERRLFYGGTFLLAAVIVMNLLMLYLARGLTELDVFNPRYLVPILMVFLALAVSLAGWLWMITGRPIRLALAGCILVFLVYYAYRTADFSLAMAETGLGYSNVGWHNSETIEYLRQHPELVDLVSTGEMGIYFWTGRMPKVISAFGSVEGLRQYLCERGAPLFVMNQMPAEIYGISHDEVAQTFVLEHEFNDSEMYRCPSAKD